MVGTMDDEYLAGTLGAVDVPSRLIASCRGFVG